VDRRDRQETFNGFGNALSRAVELTVTPAIFGGLGWLLDRAVGTSPLFLVLFAILTVVGIGLRMYYGYDAEMRAQEERLLGRATKARLFGERGPDGGHVPGSAR
jgi:hypothetical protein